MVKKIFLLSSLLLLGVCVGTSFALPVLPTGSIYDTYLHPNDDQETQQNTDVIGNSNIFDIYGHRWVTDQSKLDIYLSWNQPELNDEYLEARLGDVFFYDSSGELDLFIPVREHTSGYDGNGMQQGIVYSVEDTRSSNLYYPNPPWDTSNYGDNEIVTGGGSFAGYDFVSVNYATGSEYNTISLDFSESDFGIFEGLEIRFAYTCGNDVHAPAAPVPEPATMILLGTGLIGLAGIGRKKFKKEKN